MTVIQTDLNSGWLDREAKDCEYCRVGMPNQNGALDAETLAGTK